MEERLIYLEGVYQFVLDALDMASSIVDFQTSINRLHDPSLILKAARDRIQRLIPFLASAFFLVEESSSDFFLFDCEPADEKRSLQGVVDEFIDDGSFGRALRVNKPLALHSKESDEATLLHVMTTESRVRGMFVGIPAQQLGVIPAISLSLFSMVIRSGANALESFELYKRIRESEG
jgi:hypothetical protein